MSLFLPRRLHRLFFLLAALVASLSAVHGATAEKLPALNIDIGETSISGLSSGAFASV